MNEAGEGVVYYGRPIPLREIENDTGLPLGTLHRWMDLLIQQDYVRVEIVTNEGTIFWVLNAKNKAKGRRSIRGTAKETSVPDVELQRSSIGTPNLTKMLENMPVAEFPTKIASKSQNHSNKDAAAKAAAGVSSLSIEEQKQELRRRGHLQ